MTNPAASALRDPRLLDRAGDILAALTRDSQLVIPDMEGYWTSYLQTHTGHFLELLELVQRADEPASVLDVGNFPGHFTVLLKQLGLDVTEVDLEPERAADLWRHHKILERRVDIEREALPFDSGSFDAVVFAEVLEHLRIDPIHALRECRRVLKPGGSLILSMPNVSPRHRIRFLLARTTKATSLRNSSGSRSLATWATSDSTRSERSSGSSDTSVFDLGSYGWPARCPVGGGASCATSRGGTGSARISTCLPICSSRWVIAILARRSVAARTTPGESGYSAASSGGSEERPVRTQTRAWKDDEIRDEGG
jgi:SAM-dependent methyltransferase